MRAVVSAGTPHTPRLNDTSACAYRLGVAAAAALTVALGCSDDSERRLDPISVAMPGDEGFAPIYSDDELTIYESKTSLMLPIVAPRPEQLEALNSEAADPFERLPWVKQSDVHVQVTWTLSNLDPDAHAVWVMIDPWNEFGRYEPAVHISDEGATRDIGRRPPRGGGLPASRTAVVTRRHGSLRRRRAAARARTRITRPRPAPPPACRPATARDRRRRRCAR